MPGLCQGMLAEQYSLCSNTVIKTEFERHELSDLGLLLLLY